MTSLQMATNSLLTQCTHQLNIRSLGQQTRWNQQHEPIARQSLPSLLTEEVSLRHRLDSCNVLCISCGANHWIEEKIQKNTLQAPKFSTCCRAGIIAMDKFDEPPQPLYSLLIDSTLCSYSIIYSLIN